MSRLIRELIRPYRGTLLVIFIAMMVETLMSLAGPWPLKIILDNVQRQRIGIARAVIRNTPILILDEPTAALDTESERLVIEALERLLKGRTVITIAHRLSTIRDANKIIVLSAGVVAEQGTHQELIALGGVYAELHRIQVDGVSETIAS
jgi:ABC-type multidrug transport system fused ATPase/permease subunit